MHGLYASLQAVVQTWSIFPGGELKILKVYANPLFYTCRIPFHDITFAISPRYGYYC